VVIVGAGDLSEGILMAESILTIVLADGSVSGILHAVSVEAIIAGAVLVSVDLSASSASGEPWELSISIVGWEWHNIINNWSVVSPPFWVVVVGAGHESVSQSAEFIETI